MFIIIVIAAIFIINKNDLAPASQKFTRSPHGITAAVCRKAGGDFLPGVGPPLFLYAKGRREALETAFPSAHDLPPFPYGLLN